jgi:hypothetical protein
MRTLTSEFTSEIKDQIVLNASLTEAARMKKAIDKMLGDSAADNLHASVKAEAENARQSYLSFLEVLNAYRGS